MASIYRGDGPQFLRAAVLADQRRTVRLVQNLARDCEGFADLANRFAEQGDTESAARHRRIAERHAFEALCQAGAHFNFKARLLTGLGSAGQCPGDSTPKTPAAQERGSRDATASTDAGDTFTRGTAHPAAREGIA